VVCENAWGWRAAISEPGQFSKSDPRGRGAPKVDTVTSKKGVRIFEELWGHKFFDLRDDVAVQGSLDVVPSTMLEAASSVSVPFRIRPEQNMDMDGYYRSSQGGSVGQERSPSNASQLDITEMLQRWKNGDVAALEKLTERIYGQLRRLADNALGKDWGNQSLQPTELVHETYLRLVDAQQVDWKSRPPVPALL
jgi:hypothetical protein